jgi:hypothetical protein
MKSEEQIEVELAKEQLERKLGVELPKGACVCRIEKGHYALSFDLATADEKMMNIIKAMQNTGGKAKLVTSAQIREECSGHYVRKE